MNASSPWPRFRSAVLDVHPYQPGRPSDEVERELGLTDLVKLASNENCLGTSPVALEAGRVALERGVHLYPDGSSFHLRHALAARHGVTPAQVFVASGASEAILLLAQALLEPGTSAVCSEGAFHLYELAVRATGAEVLAAPLDAEERHDLVAMAAAVREDTRLLFIANPNNPTGTYVPRDHLVRLLETVPPGVVVVLDEAYFDYVQADDYPDGIALAGGARPLVVLRTFSKIHGLAGMRVGYAIAPEELVSGLDRIRSAFNVSSLAQVMALAALDDSEHVSRSVAHNQRELQFLAGSLRARGYRLTDSVANFVLIELGAPAEPVHEQLLRRGVITRPMAGFGFPTRLRVSVGQREANERFLNALAEIGP